MKYSTEYASALALIMISVLGIFKIEFTQAEAETWITGIVATISGLNLLIKRYKRGGINALGVRK